MFHIVIFREVNAIESVGVESARVKFKPLQNFVITKSSSTQYRDLYLKDNKIFRLLDCLFSCFLKGFRVLFGQCSSKQVSGNPVRVKLYHPS